MGDIQTITYENILRVIHNWPLSERLNLVQDILKTLAPELKNSKLSVSHTRRNTLKEALGLLATHQPPPSDEEIQDWLDEHRREKYG
jgi:hypothetical protein